VGCWIDSKLEQERGDYQECHDNHRRGGFPIIDSSNDRADGGSGRLERQNRTIGFTLRFMRWIEVGQVGPGVGSFPETTLKPQPVEIV
jgi:hypothetical protein